MKVKVVTGQEYVEPVIEIKCHEVTKEIENVIDIAAGKRHSLILTKDGKLYSFGYNSNGELGRSSDLGLYNPIEISTISN